MFPGSSICGFAGNDLAQRDEVNVNYGHSSGMMPSAPFGCENYHSDDDNFMSPRVLFADSPDPSRNPILPGRPIGRFYFRFGSIRIFLLIGLDCRWCFPKR